MPLRTAKQGWNQLRHATQMALAHCIRFVFLRPGLRRPLSWGLKKLPRLHQRLLNMGINTGAVHMRPFTKGQGPTGVLAVASGSGDAYHVGKKVAVLAPGAANGTSGGAERFYSGLIKALRAQGYATDLVCLTVDESSFASIQASYRTFSELDLSAYDLVISTKAPTYVVQHPNHVLYLVHTVRVFYDMFEDAFPTPTPELIERREWIHKTDSAAFARIKHRFSIGKEVSQRMEQWNASNAEVLHPPIDVDGLYDQGIGDYFFMPGRLHPWKRVELAIAAVKRSGLPLRLLIAGTGEAEASLRELAGKDTRIEFLGQVSDEQLKALYAGALAVPFVPLREDYGYVTLEAFASGKPVVTCMDSGEPTQFVENEVTGFVCEPNPGAVCIAFERLWNDRGLAQKLGRAGRERVRDIRWPIVASRLLHAGFGKASLPTVSQEKLHIAILDMQPITPAIGGGRLRLLGLYHALGENIEARYIGSYDWPGEKFRRHAISPTLEEIDVPLSAAHHKAAVETAQKAGGKTVIDMLFGKQGHLSPSYIEEAEDAIKWADVVIFSHPWVAPLIKDDLLQGKMVVYDAQNVEKTLRAQILDEKDDYQRSILEEVEQAERLVGERADLILACSEEDAEGFGREYGWHKTDIAVVPNGVFANAISVPSAKQKANARKSLGISQDKRIAFFIGSDYAPNIEAANKIIQDIAPACPEVEFAIVGGVCGRLAAPRAGNVRLVGFVDDAQRLAWLQAVDFAINPMCSGSGTNIKMFDFMAAGLPIVSTPIGARGIADVSTVGIRLADFEVMPAAIMELITSPTLMAQAGPANRAVIERSFSWERISPTLGMHLWSRWRRKQGAAILAAADRPVRKQRIAHLTTTGIKCGIGEYTKKIVHVFQENGFDNLIMNCDSAAEQASPMEGGIESHVAWYFDNADWQDSHIKPNAFSQLVEWQADSILIQYHPSFFSPDVLWRFAIGCLERNLGVTLVVHNYTEECAAVLRDLNTYGVTIFSHREEEIHEAKHHRVNLELTPLGVDIVEPAIVRTISGRDLARHPPLIITNGFLRKHKGAATLIKAMPAILEAIPAAQLRIQCALYPSEDSQKELMECQQAILDLGLKDHVTIDTRFLDKSEMLAELAKADLAVLPYENSNEGGSASATDAFAVGLPLIVSTAEIFDAIREVAVTSPPDPDALARTILDVLLSEEKYDWLAHASLGYAKNNSWANVAGSFLTAV